MEIFNHRQIIAVYTEEARVAAGGNGDDVLPPPPPAGNGGNGGNVTPSPPPAGNGGNLEYKYHRKKEEDARLVKATAASI
ncbi:hypothetical protein LTR47_004744 [Exophiala xenobiotica]|nr:hypothetical protein LTR72_006599 [Exophiala xenobiotica]KAK5234153.1 hypothetical protein LTR47_004744 [Exophiala xenobiotica]KAK5281432.1 hypothetical protein LTR40_004866 [Exophiala xenobiotica]KAK5287270.1 hypothetical protein LTR14_009334 [Exophiala xenobiotica]KAK5325115.1 hypothetical protein LTR93_004592 [Exophiala xenobiotica]